jgi:RNA polymerase sigma-70 factor (ECF subfamily)
LPLPSDDILIARIQAGDESAFEALVDCYHRSMLKIARTWVRSPEAAEEVVQDTWVAVIGGLDRFEARSSLKTWLFRILANRARTKATRDGRQVPFSALLTADDHEGDTPPEERFAADGQWAVAPATWGAGDPEAKVLQDEVQAVIERTLEVLPPAQRAVVTLRDVEGLSAAEACNILDVSESNQRVLLHRARTRLRAAVEAHLS